MEWNSDPNPETQPATTPWAGAAPSPLVLDLPALQAIQRALMEDVEKTAPQKADMATQLVRERAAALGNGLSEAVNDDPRGPVARLIFLSGGDPNTLLKLAVEANIPLPPGQLEEQRKQMELTAQQNQRENLALAKEAASVVAASAFWDKFVSSANAEVREQNASEEKQQKPVSQMTSADIIKMDFTSWNSLSEAEKGELKDRTRDDIIKTIDSHHHAQDVLRLKSESEWGKDTAVKMEADIKAAAGYSMTSKADVDKLDANWSAEGYDAAQRARMLEWWKNQQMEQGGIEKLHQLDAANDNKANFTATTTTKDYEVNGRAAGGETVDTKIGQVEQHKQLALDARVHADTPQAAADFINSEGAGRVDKASTNTQVEASAGAASVQTFTNQADDFGEAPAVPTAQTVAATLPAPPSGPSQADYTNDLTQLQRAQAMFAAADAADFSPANSSQLPKPTTKPAQGPGNSAG